jgi:hypothetical protein
MPSLARLRLTTALLLCQRVASWITITQARYGTSIEHIRNESRGINIGSPDKTLGHLWSLPVNGFDQKGLGGSITWAWDSRMCAQLLPQFKDEFWFISLISCEGLRASMHRAFDTWAQNSRYIKFTDVTEQCIAGGYAASLSDCPHAEIVVTDLPAANLTAGVRNVSDPVVSTPRTAFTSTFESTSGYRPFRGFGQSPGAPLGTFFFTAVRPVPEAIGGSIEFRSDVCYYLDSQFCQGFHDWKRVHGSVGAFFLFNLCFFLVVGTALALVVVKFAVAAKRFTKMHDKLLLETGVDVNNDGLDDITITARIETMLAVIAEFSFRGTIARLFALIVPWPFFSAVHQCWACYDFESAAAHHVGHLLGLGHPDQPTQEVYKGFTAEGTVSYHALLSSGGYLNASSCTNPWMDVYPGLPPDADIRSKSLGYRRSIMESFTKDAVSNCLQDDDLEALNVLYPDCHGGLATPVCLKSALNVGWLRLMIFIIGPLITAVLAGMILALVARRCRGHAYWKRAEAREALEAAATAEAAVAIGAAARGHIERKKLNR